MTPKAKIILTTVGLVVLFFVVAAGSYVFYFSHIYEQTEGVNLSNKVSNNKNNVDEIKETIWERGKDKDEFFVTNPTTEAKLYVKIFYPDNFKTGEKTDALVLVPGGNSGSSTFIGPKKSVDDITGAGLVAVVFDPDGRGMSSGVENQNGYDQQDGLAAIISFLVDELPDAQIDDVGIATFSFGLSMGSGVAVRYPELPIRFLIDWEGPIDRNDFAGCDSGHTGHLTDEVDCDNEAYFSEREGISFVPQLDIPYIRLQTEKDHAQPDTLSAVRIVNAAVSAGLSYVRLNDYEVNQTYNEENPPEMFPDNLDRSLMAKVAEDAKELF